MWYSLWRTHQKYIFSWFQNNNGRWSSSTMNVCVTLLSSALMNLTSSGASGEERLAEVQEESIYRCNRTGMEVFDIWSWSRFLVKIVFIYSVSPPWKADQSNSGSLLSFPCDTNSPFPLSMNDNVFRLREKKCQANSSLEININNKGTTSLLHHKYDKIVLLVLRVINGMLDHKFKDKTF